MFKSAFFRSQQSQALLDAVDQAVRERQKAEAFADVGRLGITALGVGAAARGIGGLMSAFAKPPTHMYGPSTLTMPYPVKKKKEKKADDEPWRPGFTNLAVGTSGAMFGGAGGLVGGKHLGEGVVNTLNEIHQSGAPRTMNTGHAPGNLSVKTGPLWKNMPAARVRGRNLGALLGLLGGTLGGAGLGHLIGYHAEHSPKLKPRQKNASSKTSLPWYRPAMALTGLAGLYGGWKTVDHVLDSQRRKAREKELEQARQEFHHVLLSGDVPGTKVSADQLVDRLGSVFDLLQRFVGQVKIAGPLQDTFGEAAGLYGTYAALSGLASGAIVYEQAKKRQRRAILDKALKKRQSAHFKTTPSEMVAIPEPAEVA